MKNLIAASLLVVSSSMAHAYQIECKPAMPWGWPLNANITITPTSLQSGIIVVDRLLMGKRDRKNYEVVMFSRENGHSWIHDTFELNLTDRTDDGKLTGVFSSDYGEQEIICSYK